MRNYSKGIAIRENCGGCGPSAVEPDQTAKWNTIDPSHPVFFFFPSVRIRLPLYQIDGAAWRRDRDQHPDPHRHRYATSPLCMVRCHGHDDCQLGHNKLVCCFEGRVQRRTSARRGSTPLLQRPKRLRDCPPHSVRLVRLKRRATNTWVGMTEGGKH
ncbi:hypothetical protein LY78DRAFT_210045 [Colletotrichum sublineola]|nr:hypothetical protein LY78DRAFT_210045 [Colletotrichum sublineola]